ncbi:MAG: carboxypeptidase-like regulatory domain-containing protein, partial [Prevotella sp.]
MEFTKKVYSTVMILLFLCMSVLTAQAQTNTVKGTVSGSDGPVIGATVKVKGSSTGVVTDYDGNYTIKVKPGDVLTFSYLGMSTKEVKVGKQSKIDVTLVEDDKLLDEVVVVGYGKMKRSDLTGSVVSVNSKAIEKS